MTGYKVHKEYIWHFTCVSCNGYWSIATMDEWVPKTMFCPLWKKTLWKKTKE